MKASKIIPISLVCLLLVCVVLYFIPDFNPEQNSKIYPKSKELTGLINGKVLESLKSRDSIYIITDKYTVNECGTMDGSRNPITTIKQNFNNIVRYISYNPYAVNKYILGNKLAEIQNQNLLYGAMTNVDFYKSINQIEFASSRNKTIKPTDFKNVYELEFDGLNEDRVFISVHKFDSEEKILIASFVFENDDWKAE
jgi:hypothetical protein